MKAKLNTLRMIHFALMAGPAFFSITLAFLVLTSDQKNEGVEVLNYLSLTYFLTALVVNPFIFRAILKPGTLEHKNLPEKLTAFQSAHMIRLAILEGSALFAAVTAFINGELLHLIAVALVLAIMMSKFPSTPLLVKELRLTPEESQELMAR